MTKQPNKNPHTFSGGRANGGRKEGNEPAKRQTALSRVKLDPQEPALALQLVQTSVFGGDLLGLSTGETSVLVRGAKDNKEPAAYRAEAREQKHFRLLPQEAAIEYTPSMPNLWYIQTYSGIPGVVVNEGTSPLVVRIMPKELLAFLESEPVETLLKKIHDHDVALPVDSVGLGHPRLLENLTANTRANLVDLQRALKELSKELTLAARSGNKTHENIAEHQPGGRTE